MGRGQGAAHEGGIQSTFTHPSWVAYAHAAGCVGPSLAKTDRRRRCATLWISLVAARRRLVTHETALSHRGERSSKDVGGSLGLGLEELLASRRGSSGAMTARSYAEYMQYREEFGKRVVRTRSTHPSACGGDGGSRAGCHIPAAVVETAPAAAAPLSQCDVSGALGDARRWRRTRARGGWCAS